MFLALPGLITHASLCCCDPDVAVCPQQCPLLAGLVAAYGGLSTLCQGHGATFAGDVHTRGHQGLRLIAAGVRPLRHQVCENLALPELIA